MASKILPSQAVTAIARPVRQRAPRFSLPICSQPQVSSRRKLYSTSASEDATTRSEPAQRWKQTPPAMKAPVRLRGNPNKPEYKVNSDPEILDGFYIRMLGENGDKLLSEETKWQSVTHKSFDQGRRGFNDRLAYMGKQIILLQSSLVLIQDPASSKHPLTDPYGRTPFEHPALKGLEVLSSGKRDVLTNKTNMARLAREYGLDKVLRWIPRRPSELTESGFNTVLNHAMFAVVGAIALEKGGQAANEIVRNRILKPLGFNIHGSAA